MPKIKYRLSLTPDEREEIEAGRVMHNHSGDDNCDIIQFGASTYQQGHPEGIFVPFTSPEARHPSRRPWIYRG